MSGHCAFIYLIAKVIPTNLQHSLPSVDDLKLILTNLRCHTPGVFDFIGFFNNLEKLFIVTA